MKEIYKKPESEVTQFVSTDVITTSTVEYTTAASGADQSNGDDD